MIELKNLNKSYEKNILFNDFNMVIQAGVLTAIKGRIGSGKSTLLRIIAGLDISYGGTCSISDNICSKNDKRLSDYRLQHIGYIPQDYQLLHQLTCFKNIAFPLKLLKVSEKERTSRVTAIMNELEISHLKDKYPSEISGGQRQLVAIARALVKEPIIIIGDEPTGALDKLTEAKIIDCIKSRQTETSYIVIATHSQELAEKCDKVIELD